MSESSFAPLWASRAQIAAAIVAAVLNGGLGFLPLLGGPGYEASLIAGLILPVTAAIATALEVSGSSARPFDAIGRGALSGLWLAAIALGVAALHGARVGYCDALEGFLLMALGSGFGAVMGGVWGAAMGLCVAGARSARRRIGLSIVLGLAGPLGGVLLSLWRFYTSPMVFAFDPFFGFFAGPLYDTIIEPTFALTVYRVGSVASLIAIGVLAWHLERNAGALVLSYRGRPGVVLGGVLALATSLAITISGDRLGHWSTTESIREELGRSVTSERCEIVHAASILDRDAQLLGRECDAHVRELERWFELSYPERITVFAFESPDQKGRLMGAATTYIAKPWRREVYVQFGRFPHPVLGHELAHVVAGGAGQGPFRVAGPLWGIVPDPGRIEGVATAATPGDDDDLTLAQSAKTLLVLELLPPLERVFRLSFLGESSAKAYTVAGAFVQWLHQTRGAAAIRRWYGGETLEQATGKNLAELEREWREHLRSVTVPEQALESARARFDRPAIFDRSCPHVVDGLVQEGGAKLGANDWRGAEEAFHEALELDPHHVWAAVGSGTCAARAGRYDEARTRWERVAADPALPVVLRAAGSEAIADLDLALGLHRAARERYRNIAKNVFDDDHLRALDVKSAELDPLGREAIVALLIGDPRQGRDFSVAAARLARWAAERPAAGEPEYLLGRNFYQQGRYEAAAEHLDRAIERTIESPRLRRATLRMRVIVALALGDPTSAQRALERWLAEPGSRISEREGMQRFAKRFGLSVP